MKIERNQPLHESHYIIVIMFSYAHRGRIQREFMIIINWYINPQSQNLNWILSSFLPRPSLMDWIFSHHSVLWLFFCSLQGIGFLLLNSLFLCKSWIFLYYATRSKPPIMPNTDGTISFAEEGNDNAMKSGLDSSINCWVCIDAFDWYRDIYLVWLSAQRL